jgi:hypothetical protein
MAMHGAIFQGNYAYLYHPRLPYHYSGQVADIVSKVNLWDDRVTTWSLFSQDRGPEATT